MDTGSNQRLPETVSMEAKVIFNKGGKRNGYLPDTFETPADWENEYSDEDEVFVEDLRIDAGSASKPLMYPRQRAKVKTRGPHCRCQPILKAVFCFLFLVLLLGSLMGLVVYFVNKPKLKSDSTLIQENENVNFHFSPHLDIVGCDRIEVDDVWVVGFPKLLTESAFRLVDVNQDGFLDVILGFATGADGYNIPSIVCDIYFNGTYPCYGGLLALEGRKGTELWRHYSQHEIYGINCNADLNQDGVNDCLAGGRAGAFQAVSGKDGSLIWDFGPQEAKNDIMNLYTAQIIRDVDGDGVVDILQIHGGDPLQDPGSSYRLSGRLILFSGKTGKVLKWTGVPDNRESYYSPQVYTLMDGTEMVLFGTGGETHPGALWRITLDDLIKGRMEMATKIYSDKFKGVMTPPVLVDLTQDGIEDIVLPAFNSTVVAIDGLTSQIIWNHSFPESESYNTPSPGFYNDDDVPDFLVKFAHGPGFPVYYHSVTTVLDGKTGKALIDPPLRDTVGAQASAITLSMEGHGNDIFLYWAADCVDHEGQGGEFQFVEGTNVHEQSRSDFCRLRFKTKGFSKVYAINQHMKGPGETVYYSEDRKDDEHKYWVNTTATGVQFVKDHPEYTSEYKKFAAAENYKNEVQEDPASRTSGEGGEYLFDTPMLQGDQRTGYKKGPQRNDGFSEPRGQKIGINDMSHGQMRGYTGEQRGQEPGFAEEPRGQMPEFTDKRIVPYNTENYNYDMRSYTNPYNNYIRKNQYNNYGGLYPFYNHKNYQATTPRYYPRDRLLSRNRRPLTERGAVGKRLKQFSSKVPIHNMKRKRRRRSRDTSTFGNSDTLYRKPSKLEDTHYIPKKWILHSDFERDNIPHGNKNIFENVLSDRTRDFIIVNKNRKVNFRQKPKRKIRKRHVGAHDEKGLQRLLSTGSLAPSSLHPSHPDYNHSIDFLFATYWFFPAKTQAILPKDRKCIADMMSKETIRFDPNSKYFGLDHDNYEHAVTKECLGKGDHDLPQGGTYESQTEYNPFNIHMGQMTVYRVRITCRCGKNSTTLESEHKRCSNVLPFSEQQWSGYMGNRADSHWKTRTSDK